MIQNSTTVFTVHQWNINIKCQCDCATACPSKVCTMTQTSFEMLSRYSVCMHSSTGLYLSLATTTSLKTRVGIGNKGNDSKGKDLREMSSR